LAPLSHEIRDISHTSPPATRHKKQQERLGYYVEADECHVTRAVSSLNKRGVDFGCLGCTEENAIHNASDDGNAHESSGNGDANHGSRGERGVVVVAVL
jgi:methyl coenzyme M reductase alpha subunit